MEPYAYDTHALRYVCYVLVKKIFRSLKNKDGYGHFEEKDGEEASILSMKQKGTLSLERR